MTFRQLGLAVILFSSSHVTYADVLIFGDEQCPSGEKCIRRPECEKYAVPANLKSDGPFLQPRQCLGDPNWFPPKPLNEASGAATDKSHFNLYCSLSNYNMTKIEAERAQLDTTKFGIEYRIDLAANKWCSGKCDSVRAIARHTDTEIVLVDEKAEQQSEKTFIDRISGRFSTVAKLSIPGQMLKSDSISGTCEKRNFRPLPSPKF